MTSMTPTEKLIAAAKAVLENIGGWRELIAELDDMPKNEAVGKAMWAALDQVDGCKKALRAAIKDAEAQPAVCRWTCDDIYDYYNTECGQTWTLIEGTPKDNGVRFCHGCGKSIEEVKQEAENEH